MKLSPLITIGSAVWVSVFATAPAQAALALRYAEDIPSNQRILIQKDFEVLERLSFTEEDPALARLLHLRTGSAGEMSEWLAERVKILVSEQLDEERSVVTLQERYAYENPGLLPDAEESELPPSAGSSFRSRLRKPKFVMVMTNWGGGQYVEGKRAGKLFGLEIPGVGRVPITSPRVGIIQVGSGLFDHLAGLHARNDALPYSLLRLSSYFHEARHGDGNGSSLTFAHAVCPPSHVYAGRYACDRHLNGSYTVSARVLSAFARHCESCSAADREALKVRALDHFDRVLKVQLVKDAAGQPLPVGDWDERPEGKW